MKLSKLPNELILVLGAWAEVPTVCALATTSRRLYDILNPLLYRRNVRE
jgi:hypothetical protein